MPLDIFSDPARLAAFEQRHERLRQMQRRQRVRFQCLTHGCQLYLKAGRFLFRDNAGIIDQCIQMAKALLQKLAQCRDAPRPGRIQRVQLHRQILRGQLLYRFLASASACRLRIAD